MRAILLAVMMCLVTHSVCAKVDKVLVDRVVVDKVVVEKSKATLYLLDGDKIIREYSVALGGNPVGHKEQEGDERTPEGEYILDYKKSDSAFYRSIHISYPNADDQNRAKGLAVSPGGLIMIHGQKNGFAWLSPVMQWFNWTDGCIALSNSEMEELWSLVEVGTVIEILP
ncbi:MAG: hypothetical protein COB04_06100 [Gammaproteobacteria bacterium]|nr:MAG: hypothetical protein COB04_06100 [Gammaproteobacteria bacterium]